MASPILLPSLGDGIAGGTVATIVAQIGQTVGENDTLLELETDKAVIPVPAGVSGTITKISVKPGQEVKVGEVLVEIEGSTGAIAPPTSTTISKGDFIVPNLGDGIESGTIATFKVKIGDAVADGDTLFELETDKAVVPVPASFSGKIAEIFVKEGSVVKVSEKVLSYEGTSSASTPAPTSSAPASSPTPAVVVTSLPLVAGKAVAAGPATRKLARELGVDLSRVPGTARGGRVTIDDVKKFVKTAMTSGVSSAPAKPAAPPLPDFSLFGKIKKEPLSRIRKIISERLSGAWQRIPHVHQFQDVDVSALTELGKKHGEAFKEKGSALSVTLFLIKGLAEAIKMFPAFNSSLDDENNILILKEYFNIGVAVDTPDGLVVPVLKAVDKMSIFEIGKQLKDIAKKARDKKLMPADMQGASMTLSNLGGIGGTHFTPIVNPPEVAILGAGRGSVKPIWISGAFVPRTILPLCLAYDHRVIDGADGARFTVYLTEYLEQFVEKNKDQDLLKVLGLP
jgi:pyruvate dehydrogenase E2 component (dihydrolipoamide acetyltransferase)